MFGDDGGDGGGDDGGEVGSGDGVEFRDERLLFEWCVDE